MRVLLKVSQNFDGNGFLSSCTSPSLILRSLAVPAFPFSAFAPLQAAKEQWPGLFDGVPAEAEDKILAEMRTVSSTPLRSVPSIPQPPLQSSFPAFVLPLLTFPCPRTGNHLLGLTSACENAALQSVLLGSSHYSGAKQAANGLPGCFLRPTLPGVRCVHFLCAGAPRGGDGI